MDVRVDLMHKRGHNHVRRVRHGKIKRKEGNGEDEDAGVEIGRASCRERV